MSRHIRTRFADYSNSSKCSWIIMDNNDNNVFEHLRCALCPQGKRRRLRINVYPQFNL